jgi:hypothetical protein
MLKIQIYLHEEGTFIILFCFVLFGTYEIHQIRMLQIAFLVSLESSKGGGVYGILTCGIKVFEY